MLVLDCSAAMAIVLKTEEGTALASLMLKDEKVLSTQLFIAEMSSALSKHVKAGDSDSKLARILCTQALDLVDEFVDMSENCLEALDEGIRHGHSTYDMFYLTLARRNGATIFTLDHRLIALCEKLKIDCVHVMAPDGVASL